MSEVQFVVKTKCRAGCGRTFEIKTITQKQFDAWRGGALIQSAMPHISKEERELLISGTCGECWEELFNFEED